MTDGFLGIDTSNYSTSAAYIGDEVRSAVKLLPVKKGEGGIRQSDAVFHHTKQLPSQVDGRVRRRCDWLGKCRACLQDLASGGAYHGCALFCGQD